MNKEINKERKKKKERKKIISVLVVIVIGVNKNMTKHCFIKVISIGKV